jgi:hypothetical protein
MPFVTEHLETMRAEYGHDGVSGVYDIRNSSDFACVCMERCEYVGERWKDANMWGKDGKMRICGGKMQTAPL